MIDAHFGAHRQKSVVFQFCRSSARQSNGHDDAARAWAAQHSSLVDRYQPNRTGNGPCSLRRCITDMQADLDRERKMMTRLWAALRVTPFTSADLIRRARDGIEK
jgi:hypothetical protein